jgi:lysophospholipase L1-like esterase
MRSLAVLLLLAGCSTSPATTQPSDGGGASAEGGDDSASPPSLPGTFGSYVVLGDSISDQGAGPATQPIYRDLLYKNDDTLYPAWKGLTLKDKLGVQQYVPKAVGGSLTSDLIAQLGTVPASLPTPILVTVTSGGNDLHGALGDVVLNPSVGAADAQKMADNVDAFLKAIGDRYPGQVYVLEANIYDPSGDTGNFNGCSGLIPIDPKVDHDAFAQWNGDLATAVAKHPPALVAPLHDTFMGHDVHAADDWFYTDCIHPTKNGQHQIRRMFWKMLTGQDGPP